MCVLNNTILILKGEVKMAKLSNLKMRKDYEERQIKCLIVEDYTTGDLVKYYNPSEFGKVIENTEPDLLTRVYSPTQEEKNDIFNIISGDLQAKDGVVDVEITDETLVLSLFKRFTDVEIDIEDEAGIKEIMQNPNELFLAIKMELDKVLMSVLENFVATYKTLKSNPQTVEVLSEQAMERAELQKKLEREKKVQELQKQLAELTKDNA